MFFEVESLRKGYADIGWAILDDGQEVSPRGMKTKELLHVTIFCHDPIDTLPAHTGRGIVTALGAVETLQLIGGFHDPKMLVKAAPHFANFLDTDGEQRAPYGPRLEKQIPTAIQHLKEDADSRQAQVVIWDPYADNMVGLNAYPCTTSLQWFIRDNKLHARTHMRSNDFYLGLPYDAFQFSQLQITIASILGIEPGHYAHSATSLHVYEHHWESVDKLTTPTKEEGLPTYGLKARDWFDAQVKARMLHDKDQLPDGWLPGEKWLSLAMSKIR